MIAAVLEAAGELAHNYLTTTPEQDAIGLWLTDEADQAGIAGPAAALLGRRGLGGAATGDVGDLVTIATTVIGYGIKQMGKLMAAKRWRKHAQANPGAQVLPGETLQP